MEEEGENPAFGVQRASRLELGITIHKIRVHGYTF